MAESSRQSHRSATSNNRPESGFGHFGSLQFAEDSAYTTATLQDGAATYVPRKRGELVTITRETIINDDLQAVKQIPTKLAKAAALYSG